MQPAEVTPGDWLPPETRRAVEEHGRGFAAGLAGEPDMATSSAFSSGWIAGDVKRRVRAKEALGFVAQGTRCEVCKRTNWGWRLGCRCAAADEEQPIEWGALVDDGLADGEPAKFMTVQQIRAASLPLLDIFTGKAIKT
jgi:hypothetical protein